MQKNSKETRKGQTWAWMRKTGHEYNGMHLGKLTDFNVGADFQ